MKPSKATITTGSWAHQLDVNGQCGAFQWGRNAPRLASRTRFVRYLLVVGCPAPLCCLASLATTVHRCVAKQVHGRDRNPIQRSHGQGKGRSSWVKRELTENPCQVHHRKEFCTEKAGCTAPGITTQYLRSRCSYDLTTSSVANWDPGTETRPGNRKSVVTTLGVMFGPRSEYRP